MTLLHPTYFPSITAFATILQNEVCWEVHDNYQKQTYRNRMKICNDRGLHVLSIPIVHVGSAQGRQLYKDVKIDNTYDWQRQHWRTLETAYRTSPFFEFYEDEIRPLYDIKYTNLLDYNRTTIKTVCDMLQIEMPKLESSAFRLNVDEIKDFRFLVDAKKKIQLDFAAYHQVFGDRHHFIPDQSILDLLFNSGPQAAIYLSNLNLDMPND